MYSSNLAAWGLPDETASATHCIVRQPMNFLKLVKPSVDYDRRLVDSAVQGARTGEREFSKRRRLVPYLFESAGRAVGPAVIGACVGIVSSYLRNGRCCASRAVAGGLLGAAIGLGAGFLWESRELTSSVASRPGRVSEGSEKHTKKGP